MTTPIAPTVIEHLPPTARQILRDARHRYRALPVNGRPAQCPTSIIGLFAPEELIALAQSGVLPHESPVAEWLTASPRKARRRRWRLDARIRALVLDVLADELPEAVGVLLAQAKGVTR